MGSSPGPLAFPYLALWEEPAEDFVPSEPVVSRDVGDDAGQRTDTEGCVVRDGEMVLRLRARRQSDMAAGLPDDFVPECAEGVRKITPGDVARQPHTAMS